jgi:hypothetical protein
MSGKLPAFRWPGVERVLSDRIWSDATASGSVLKFWVSGSIELRYSEDQAAVEELANAVGLTEQLAFTRKQSRLEPNKISIVQASTDLCFTTVLVRAGVPLLVQLEVSRSFRKEGLKCYEGYVEACRALLAGKQIPAPESN